MTPPAAPENGNPPAVSSRLEVLRKRSDFVALSHARRLARPGFVLQARPRGDDGPPRVGFTCSRKVGNAVARNRAKRRLRELARAALAPLARPGWDYALIGRAGKTADLPFDQLIADLSSAAEAIHEDAK